jgi:hypothetical protein
MSEISMNSRGGNAHLADNLLKRSREIGDEEAEIEMHYKKKGHKTFGNIKEY